MELGADDNLCLQSVAYREAYTSDDPEKEKNPGRKSKKKKGGKR